MHKTTDQGPIIFSVDYQFDPLFLLSFVTKRSAVMVNLRDPQAACVSRSGPSHSVIGFYTLRLPQDIATGQLRTNSHDNFYEKPTSG